MDFIICFNSSTNNQIGPTMYVDTRNDTKDEQEDHEEAPILPIKVIAENQPQSTKEGASIQVECSYEEGNTKKEEQLKLQLHMRQTFNETVYTVEANKQGLMNPPITWLNVDITQLKPIVRTMIQGATETQQLLEFEICKST
ncbi:hypothetical protein KP509_26G008200 [Ceratopteris richardii]|uniref:Uncharacterized protein n=1 Tax=Ceratopteris richardii TaxID=49495 RepID=A0A8T2RKM2_CERRI|nr:hypothetical protein KP509_26G008200 [Ceratopteris richardii]